VVRASVSAVKVVVSTNVIMNASLLSSIRGFDKKKLQSGGSDSGSSDDDGMSSCSVKLCKIMNNT
jgi:hypothetical protein